MSINHAILGILSDQSLTGYDLKKIIQESPFMPWSGNNNQIYKALVELLDEDFVTNEICHQESAPSKKIYTITAAGKAALREWVLSRPEAPEFKKTFLIQLAWADQLNTEEISTLLASYENELRVQIVVLQEKKRRGSFSPDRTPREVLLWDAIHDNLISSNQYELNWVQELRDKLCVNVEEAAKTNYQVVEKNGQKYIEFASAETSLHSEQDVLDAVAACHENDIYRILIPSEVLGEDFFKLKTGAAGRLLQKFVNYKIKVAITIHDERKVKGKFKELFAETNKGNACRMFFNTQEATDWLLSMP